VVDDEAELVRANSRLALVSLVASMVGGVPAAILQWAFNASWSLVLAMIVFFVATVLATRIPRTQVVQDPEEVRLEKEEIHQPSILLAGSAMAVIRIAVGVIVFLSAFSFRGDNIKLFIVLGAYGVGGFAGNLIAPIARRHAREEVILVTCLLGAASFVLFGAVVGGSTGGAALAAIAVATASAAGRVGFDSLLQRDGPDAARGRAFARFETRFQIAWVFGALFGLIPFGEGVGLLALGLLLLFAGLSYLAALRTARTRPQRTTLRPEAVDRAFVKAKGELRERYQRNREERRRERSARREPDANESARSPKPTAPRSPHAPKPPARRHPPPSV
jgi:predicted MFS family arabinose efflux permease